MEKNFPGNTLQRSNPLAWPQGAKEAAKQHFHPSCAVCRTSSGALLGHSRPKKPPSNTFTQLLNTRTIFGVNKLPEEPRTGQVPRALLNCHHPHQCFLSTHYFIKTSPGAPLLFAKLFFFQLSSENNQQMLKRRSTLSITKINVIWKS